MTTDTNTETNTRTNTETNTRTGDLLEGRRATVVLAGLAGLLVVAVLVEAAYLLQVVLFPRPTVSAARPVVVGELVHEAAVDTASRHVAEILTTNWQDYDTEVTEAQGLMTDEFAAEYAQTATDIRDEIVAAKTTITFTVVGQGVVTATDEQVEALLFLNQSVSKAGGPPKHTAYRALVSMVATDEGWLVSGIETR